MFNKLTNSEFSNILKDTIEYIEEQKKFVNIVPTDTESVIALRTWSETSEIQNILQECISGDVSE